MKSNTIIFIIIAIIFTSCCTKEDCTTQTNFKEIVLKNFDESDIANAYLLVDVRINNSYTQQDSLPFNTQNFNPSNGRYKLKNKYMNNKRFRLMLPNAQKEYVVDDIKIKRGSCNTCVINFSKNEYDDLLISYNINGNLINKDHIEIVK